LAGSGWRDPGLRLGPTGHSVTGCSRITIRLVGVPGGNLKRRDLWEIAAWNRRRNTNQARELGSAAHYKHFDCVMVTSTPRIGWHTVNLHPGYMRHSLAVSHGSFVMRRGQTAASMRLFSESVAVTACGYTRLRWSAALCPEFYKLGTNRNLFGLNYKPWS
jgi:hypothetical protein